MTKVATNISSKTYTEVHEALDVLLKDADHEAMDLAMATVKANEMEGDAVAVFLVGPPASGKTELVMACSKTPSAYWLSEVSANTFGSGLSTTAAGGKETSLLLKLERLNVHTLLLKEFGTILSKRSSDKAEIIGQLRDILDGQYRKEHGSGRTVLWEGLLGMLAGVTGEIEKQWATVRRLGDRWLIVKPKVPTDTQSRLEIGLAALNSSGESEHTRLWLAGNVTDHLREMGTPSDDDISFPLDLMKEVVEAANHLAVLRTPVSRDSYTKNVDESPVPEQPGRLAKALGKITRALAVVRGRTAVTDEDIMTIHRVVEDSVPTRRSNVLNALWEGNNSPEDISSQVGVSKTQIGRELDELRLLGAAKSVDGVWKPLM